MATIKDGYTGRPLEIKVFKAEGHEGKAEIWTEMFDGMKHSEYEIAGDNLDDSKFRTEVLHYATLQELVDLRNEINAVIKEVAGV